jgi:hypothetical protein
MGNRGRLHGPDGQLEQARWRHRNWVCCVTEFRGRHRVFFNDTATTEIYTALFFWDEASALAAGHRPCAECRNADYKRYKAAWAAAGLPGRAAAEIDSILHAARVTRDRRQVTHRAEASTLPDGVFIAIGGAPHLIHRHRPWHWSPDGYAEAGEMPPGQVEVLTPAPTVAVLRAGYAPALRQ